MDKEIIIAIIGAVGVIAGGSLIAIRRSKRSNNKVDQSGITISGNDGKVVGGDDNSTNNA